MMGEAHFPLIIEFTVTRDGEQKIVTIT
jgi:hypothetical protein